MLAGRKLIFGSYSQKDSAVVNELLRILCSMPGDDWSCEISQYLGEADVLVVFWSRHAAETDSVRKDYLSAIDMGMRVIPVRLDDLALPSEMAAFEAISCEAFVGEKHARRLRMVYGYIAAALGGVVGLVLSLWALYLLLFVAAYYSQLSSWGKVLVCTGFAVWLAVNAIAIRWGSRAWKRKMEASSAGVPVGDTPLAKAAQDWHSEFRRLIQG